MDFGNRFLIIIHSISSWKRKSRVKEGANIGYYFDADNIMCTLLIFITSMHKEHPFHAKHSSGSPLFKCCRSQWKSTGNVVTPFELMGRVDFVAPNCKQDWVVSFLCLPESCSLLYHCWLGHLCNRRSGCGWRRIRCFSAGPDNGPENQRHLFWRLVFP